MRAQDDCQLLHLQALDFGPQICETVSDLPGTLLDQTLAQGGPTASKKHQWQGPSRDYKEVIGK